MKIKNYKNLKLNYLKQNIFKHNTYFVFLLSVVALLFVDFFLLEIVNAVVIGGKNSELLLLLVFN